MHEDELWQDLLPNGEPVDKPRRRGEKLSEGHICSAAHLLLWRYDENNQKEILLQKRSSSKKSWPGFYDISAAGHVNFGEKPIVAMLRETKEEINLDLTSDDLTFIGTYRLYARTWQNQVLIDELQWIYIHELVSEESIQFLDGEVEGVKWMALNEFDYRIQDESFKIVKHDKEYFALIINAIKRQ